VERVQRTHQSEVVHRWLIAVIAVVIVKDRIASLVALNLQRG
jgi:hypothetical protein